MSKWGKVWGGIKQGLAIGALFEPHIAAIDAAVNSVEEALPDKPGADKKATVEAVSDALIGTQLLGLSQEQQDQFKALRSSYIDLTVKAKNIVAEEEAAREALAAFIQTFKKAA